MSDFILKFWPKKQVEEIKIIQIKNGLLESKIIAEEIQLWGRPAFNPGIKINEHFQPRIERSNPYFETIKITIDEKNYGVIIGKEDFEYIDRNNVISIRGGEGGFEKWDSMCDRLKEISGDEYEGGWEIL